MTFDLHVFLKYKCKFLWRFGALNELQVLTIFGPFGALRRSNVLKL